MITKKTYIEAQARIAQRSAEPLQRIHLNTQVQIWEQLTPEQRTLLNAEHFILPAQPVKSDLAKEWNEAFYEWRQAWSTVGQSHQWDINEHVELKADYKTPVSVASARVDLAVIVGEIETAIANAQRLTRELEQLEQAGARAEFDDFETQNRTYFWSVRDYVEGLKRKSVLDQETVLEYEAQQAKKAMDKAHQEALEENWTRIWNARQGLSMLDDIAKLATA